jgi:hypothetical protein
MRTIAGLVLLCFTGAAFADGPRQSTKVPRFDAAVERGVQYLIARDSEVRLDGNRQALISYALYKCAVPKTDPRVASGIAGALERSKGTVYQSPSAYEHIYGAGVDAMLLADVGENKGEQYRANLQTICNYVQSVQRADGSWSDNATHPGDVSMSQYGVLALWACQRAGCTVNPQTVERAAQFFLNRGQADGGWAYRPGTSEGPGMGNSTHNMAMAGSGALGICRLMLHGSRPKAGATKKEKESVFAGTDVIQKEEEEELEPGVVPPAFADFKPSIAASTMDARVDRGLDWNRRFFEPVSKAEHNMYYYYCLERAAAVGDIGNFNGQDWFVVYGDGLLTLQGQDGAFATWAGPEVGTALALLYYMRSTDQIIKNLYGKGAMRGDRGNVFGEKKNTKPPSELDQLLASMDNIDFKNLDESSIDIADEVVRSVQSIEDPKELVGQKENLKKLIRHPVADVRRSVYWALGRTGDFGLVPQMLEGLKDPNVDVNIEAEMALRFIARKPNGFGNSIDPLGGLDDKAPPEERLKNANEWRLKSFKQWSDWYFSIRPFEEKDGLDELEAATFAGVKANDDSKTEKKDGKKN